MIYLLGGPPKCGKTTLAKQLANDYQIPWISADTLENIVWAYTPQKKHAVLFPHKYSRGRSNDEFYSEHPRDDVINALSYLTPELANKVAVSYGNDPAKLLAIPHPLSFVVRDGTGDTKSQEVRVIFKVASGPDLTVYFSVRADNHGRWLISTIQKNVPSPSLPR